MSYSGPYIDDAGLHIPTYDDVLQYLMEQYRSIFGQDVYLGVDSQDYQLLALYARMWDELGSLMIDVYNSRNPNWATGTQLDTLVAFNGIRRRPATYSYVYLRMTGVPCAVLPAGLSARDANGFSWITQAQATLDESGSAFVQAKCSDAGAVSADVGTITICETPNYYWHAVTNDQPAMIGADQQTDAELRERRSISIAGASGASLDGIRAALSKLDGVTRVSIIENNGGTTDANGIPSHSICAVVYGGTDAEIAEAIYRKKAPGIGTAGNKTVNHATDMGSVIPIKFSRPAMLQATTTITIRKLPGFDEVATVSKIKDAVQRYINNLGIGQDITVPYLYAQIYRAMPDASPTFIVTFLDVNGQQSAVSARYNEMFVSKAVEVSAE